MKWLNQLLLIIYGLGAFYFLYQAALEIFVYFANKHLGHNESFFMAGRDLVIGLVLAAFAWWTWHAINHPSSNKYAQVLLTLPIIIIGGFFLLAIMVLISSGGKWN
jgi:hypothetical protein